MTLEVSDNGPGVDEKTAAAYRRTDLLLAIGLTAVGIGSIVGARFTIDPAQGFLVDPVGPRGFAYVIGLLMTITGVILVIQLVRRRRSGVWGDDEDVLGGDDPRYPSSSTRPFLIVAVSLVYAKLLDPLGYPISTAIFVSVCLWLMGSRKRGHLIVFPIVYALVTYVVFHTLLEVRMPSGPLSGFFELVGIDQ